MGEKSSGKSQSHDQQKNQYQSQLQSGERRENAPSELRVDKADDGMSRRTLIGGTIAAAAGGWFVFFGDDSSDGPEAVVREYAQALDNGDRESVADTIHPDAPMPDGPSASAANLMDEGTVSVEEIQSVEIEDDTAVVRAEIRIETTADSDIFTSRIELRTQNDEWKIWRVV